VPRGSDIDRLIEEGLDLYGTGNLDGALVCWERALAIDPENAQAHSYVDYVRMNYELLVTAGPKAGEENGAPAVIHDEPEYHIEVSPGELPRSAHAPKQDDSLDGGWFMEEETVRDPQVARTRTPFGPAPTRPPSAGMTPPARQPLPRGTVPPLRAETAPGETSSVTLELEADEPPAAEPAPRPPTSPGVNFEDATREYASRDDFAAPESPTSEFRPEETPTDFGSDGTSPGFGAQPTGIRPRELGFVQPSGRGAEPVRTPAEVQISIRTPGTTEPPVVATNPVPEPERSDIAIGKAPTVELGEALAKAEAQLLPDTLDMPPPRKPARITVDPDISLPDAPTRDLAIARAKTPTPQITVEDPVIGQPTRELGLRPGKQRPPTATDDDAPTRESDVRAIREAARAKGQSNQALAVPLDPIDARAAQILEDVDVGAPANETPEDRTRRRITALFDRALAYNSLPDPEKAAITIDLALAEDPVSALGQKLIHRNRETIMTVFQAYIGDLERQPQLARPLHELASSPISPRAAFLLSRIDGTLTIDEILDVSGMPRMEAYRYLCQLFLRGILK
jgi:hypothetical protein